MAIDGNKLNYFYLCSNDILKKIAKVSKSDFLSRLSLEYSSCFEIDDKVDDMWSLVSTSLLMDENLFGNENVYKNLDEDFLDNIKEIISEEAESVAFYDCYDKKSYLLDENNENINPLYYLLYKEDKFIDKESIKYYKRFGCNQVIVDENGNLDFDKFVNRIRNAIAHSNYDVLDENFLRLYHYNEQNNELDLNIKLNKIIVLTIIDELNERVFDMFNNSSYGVGIDLTLQYKTELVTDDEIINHLLSFNFLDEKKCKEILDMAKKNPKFNELSWNEEDGKYDNWDRFGILYNVINEEYISRYDYALALDELIYDKLKNQKEIGNYLWNRIGYYNYFNEGDMTKREENKMKLLLLAFLNNVILYGFNHNNDGKNINYSVMDFSKMIVDEEIINKEIRKKYNEVKNLMGELAKQEKNLVDLTNLINEDRESLFDGKRRKIENEYFNVKLPQQIDERKLQYVTDYQTYIVEKRDKQEKIYQKLFEILDFTDGVNGDLSEFIFRHLRNSLAHGYIKFPNDIDINNIESTVICFEDYEKNDKSKLTFRGTTKFGELLRILTDENVVREIFGNDSINKKGR